MRAQKRMNTEIMKPDGILPRIARIEADADGGAKGSGEIFLT